jgi:uncharacterized protein (DUF111 family)
MQQAPTQVAELVANLDDATGEVIGNAVQTLMDEGALDVWTTAITMKQGRPGVMLSVLCPIDRQDETARRMIELTGTFGVRRRQWDRTVVERAHVTVLTSFGSVRVKVGSLDGRPLVAKCEYADAVAAAKMHKVTVRQVIDAANAVAQQWLADQGRID